MLAEFRATHPVTGRTTRDSDAFTRNFFKVLHGVSIPHDHAREALDRIDLPPAEFIADVRRQLADKRELTDPRAVAAIAESNVESSIDGAISDVVAYLTTHEAECPECFPLPDGLNSEKPKQAQRILRDHLRRVIERRGTDARCQLRCFRDADRLLGVLDDYGAFTARCRKASLTDSEADDEAVWILGMVRDAMKTLVDVLPDTPTPDTILASIGNHRDLLNSERVAVEASALGVTRLYSPHQISEGLSSINVFHDDRTIKDRLDDEGVEFSQRRSKAKKNTNPRLYAWADVRRVWPQLPETPPPPAPAKRARGDKGKKHQVRNARSAR